MVCAPLKTARNSGVCALIEFGTPASLPGNSLKAGKSNSLKVSRLDGAVSGACADKHSIQLFDSRAVEKS